MDYEKELEVMAEYAEGEIIAERLERSGLATCKDCGELITDDNPAIEKHYGPDSYGNCQNCYDPTPYYPDLG